MTPRGAHIARHDLRIAAFAAAFFVVTAVTIALTRIGGGLALVWPGTAIAAALLIDLPRAYWGRALAALFAVSAIATVLFGLGPALALPLACINTLESGLLAALLRFVRPRGDWFDTVRGTGAFIAICALVPAILALPAALAVQTMAPGALWHHAQNWWTGHALGTLIGLPMIMIMTRGRSGAWDNWSRGRTLELLAHLTLTGAVAYYAIAQSHLPLLFLPTVPLLLATFRCGREGATLGTLLIAAVAAGTMHSPASPLAAFSLGVAGKVQLAQFYIATLSLVAIPISVALRQHQMLLAELVERKALTRLVADHADVALLNLGPDGRVRYASAAAGRLDAEGDAPVGRPLASFFDPLDEPLVAAVLADAAAAPGETATLERPVLHGDEQRWLETRLCAVAGEGKPGTVQGYAVTMRDITAMKDSELAAIAAAQTDALTGLPNRRALMDTLASALAHAEARPFALAIIDLDHFKAVNDTRGHLAGDIALRAVAAACTGLAAPGRLFARLGGEEFAGVIADPAEAAMLCERLRLAIATLPLRDSAGAPFRVTASIGLARIDRSQTAAEALEAADRLLYRAKARGRNRIETAREGAADRRHRRAA